MFKYSFIYRCAVLQCIYHIVLEIPFRQRTSRAHCIELGFSPLAIAERMGHEGINITFNYAHLYPSKQKALADKLNEDRENMDKDGIGEEE